MRSPAWQGEIYSLHTRANLQLSTAPFSKDGVQHAAPGQPREVEMDEISNGRVHRFTIVMKDTPDTIASKYRRIQSYAKS